MKKIIFYASCILFIAGTGCNSDNKSEKKESDSTMVKQDSGKIVAFTDPSAPNGAATINNLKNLYPQFDTAAKRVKFNYDDFMGFINSMDSIFGAKSQDIYLVYSAMTKGDTARYIQTHSGMSEADKKSLLNRPDLLIGYNNPQAPGQLIYKDLGTICPPPTSCQSIAMIPRKFIHAIANPPTLNPTASIDNYKANYVPNGEELTETVRFNIGMIDSIAKANNAADIYFWLGAYSSNDAKRYSSTRTGNVRALDIDGKCCLLFATYDGTKYSYFDFGTICPPTTSCNSTFKR